MPIHGLMPGLAEVGKIKIGIKGDEVKSKDGNTFRLPKKIDYFRIVKNERDENDDYVLDEQIIEIIKNNPAAMYNKEMNIIGIPIRLLYNEIDLVFPTQYCSYVNGKLSCSGNGIKANTRDGRETPCPCKRLDNTYTGKDKCKISGVLSCIIEGANVGGCHKFRTTSINSVRYILSSLMLIKAATGGLLSFIPLRLVINPKKTIIPTTGKPTTVYVVTVEFQGGVEQLQRKALEMGRERVSLIENMRDIEAEAKRIVSVDTEQEEKEIAEEFFPENIETKKPSATTKQEIDSEPHKKLETETAEFKKARQSIKKDTSKKKTGSEPVEPQDKAKPYKEKDDLLGTATKPESVNKPYANTTDSTVPETIVKPNADSEEKKPAKQETSTAPSMQTKTTKKPDKTWLPGMITKAQVLIILKLKANNLQINDQKAWTAIVKSMKFPDVTKANDMTTEQGDKFIAYLEELSDIPF